MKWLILSAILTAVLSATVPFADTHTLMSDPNCMKNKFLRMAFRGYLEIGKVDPNLVKNLEAAKTAGIISMVYMNPCFYCGKPGTQAEELAAVLKGFTVPHVWVSVAGTWSVDKEKNRLFLHELVGILTRLGQKPGVFTFAPTFERNMGKDCTEFSSLPLWYIRWNSNPDASDFVPFGGWKTPLAKQYDTDDYDCSMDFDNDSYFG